MSTFIQDLIKKKNPKDIKYIKIRNILNINRLKDLDAK